MEGDLIPAMAHAAAAAMGHWIWRQSESRTDGVDKVGFRFEAPLPAHFALPEVPVQTGAVVILGEEYRERKMRHLVMGSAVSPMYLKALLPIIQELFVPQKVIYNGGVEWANSCYMDVEQKMKPATMPHVAMATACKPVLSECDRLFTEWYTAHHGKSAIETLTRLQSFVTRYRPISGENQLARHVDGRSVHGSVILGLPTDDAFEGGGVTVWDGQPQSTAHYPIEPGDICFLDRCVWHQGNPITAGTRWVIVIFYAVKGSSLSRADSRARGVHTVNASSLLESVSWMQKTGKHGMQLQGGTKFEQSQQQVVAHPVDQETRVSCGEREETRHEAQAARQREAKLQILRDYKQSWAAAHMAADAKRSAAERTLDKENSPVG